MNHNQLFQAAHAAGMNALNAATPTPMRIVQTNIWGEPVPDAKVYDVPEGCCGFAWVRIKGNPAFGREMKKHGLFSRAYPTGLQFWVGEGGQSVERKEAFARAFAKVLRDNGIDAYAESRLD